MLLSLSYIDGFCKMKFLMKLFLAKSVNLIFHTHTYIYISSNYGFELLKFAPNVSYTINSKTVLP